MFDPMTMLCSEKFNLNEIEMLNNSNFPLFQDHQSQRNRYSYTQPKYLYRIFKRICLPSDIKIFEKCELSPNDQRFVQNLKKESSEIHERKSK